MAWVEAENARSLAVLKGDPRYEPFHAEALKIVNATDRIPAPELIGTCGLQLLAGPDQRARASGGGRRPESYATAAPAWETRARPRPAGGGGEDQLGLARRQLSAAALSPLPDRLSDGGEDADDAARVRPCRPSRSWTAASCCRSSKQNVDWLDDDTLIVARDWGPGTMTASGYPFVVKTLKRGQSLDQATEVFRGKPEDVAVNPVVLHDGDGHKLVADRPRHGLLPPGDLRADAERRRAALPAGQGRRAAACWTAGWSSQALEDWRGYDSAGDLVAYRPDELDGAKAAADAGASSDLLAGPLASRSSRSPSPDRVVAAIYDNVRGGLDQLPARERRLDAGARSPSRRTRPWASPRQRDRTIRLYYSVETFLAPTHLWRADAATGARGRHQGPAARASTPPAMRSTSTKRRARTEPGSPISSCIRRR